MDHYSSLTDPATTATSKEWIVLGWRTECSALAVDGYVLVCVNKETLSLNAGLWIGIYRQRSLSKGMGRQRDAAPSKFPVRDLHSNAPSCLVNQLSWWPFLHVELWTYCQFKDISLFLKSVQFSLLWSGYDLLVYYYICVDEGIFIKLLRWVDTPC